MGSASKRHGKKAWRTLDASAVEDTLAAAAQAAKSGAHVATLPDDALFFLDTKPSARECPHDSDTAPATGGSLLLVSAPPVLPCSSQAAVSPRARRCQGPAEGGRHPATQPAAALPGADGTETVGAHPFPELLAALAGNMQCSAALCVAHV